ncbi:hypothetical protein [Granulicoccus phenolivorans]|uniref:hypothetical protein n=1 Tax=Granulicoccus phenolivorans TaxID=266854 RepID=UPI0003F61A76|nr:hypothetical protein [Granulicoccus phenolivorans]
MSTSTGVPGSDSPTRPGRLQQVRRHWAPLVLTLAILLLVGAATTALDRAEVEFEDVSVRVGQAASVNGFVVSVDRVRATRTLDYDGPGRKKSATSANLILVLDVRAELPGPSETRNLDNVRLMTARGIRFAPARESMRVGTELGYRTTGYLWFEIPETDLAGARVTFVEGEILTTYRKRVVVDLGLDPATADRLRAAREPLSVSREEVSGL